MRKYLPYLSALLTLLVCSTSVPAEQPGMGSHVLTVAGAISKLSRAPTNAFKDAFFKFHEKEFKKAFAFDRRALQSLPQFTVKARAASWPKSVLAKGPYLRDVLNNAGVSTEARVTLFALDGYGAVLESMERSSKDWVLAIEVDGKPLGIGRRGPTWLLHNTGEASVDAEAEAKWVWSVFLIAVE